jgi:hypothetical protein
VFSRSHDEDDDVDAVDVKVSDENFCNYTNERQN